MTKATLIDLNLDKLCHYPIVVSSDRCSVGCNICVDPWSRICVPNKPEDVNSNVFKGGHP